MGYFIINTLTRSFVVSMSWFPDHMRVTPATSGSSDMKGRCLFNEFEAIININSAPNRTEPARAFELSLHQKLKEQKIMNILFHKDAG